MKRVMMMVAAVSACGMLAGCFTSATAYTETKHTDGSVTVSKVKVIGTGDKASQVAAEGLFADGTAEDLGAGVRTASASQTSTGIDGTLNGVANILLGVERLVAFKQGMQTEQVVARPPLDSVSSSASVATVATGAVLSGKVAEAKSAGKALVVVAENPACSYCAKFDAAVASSTLATRNDIVFVREIAPWAENSALAWTGGGDAPIVRVTTWKPDGSVACDQKLNRPSVAEVEAAIEACAVK